MIQQVVGRMLWALAALGCGREFEGIDAGRGGSSSAGSSSSAGATDAGASSAGSSSSAGTDAGGSSSAGSSSSAGTDAGGGSSAGGTDAGGAGGELVAPALCAELPITDRATWTASASSQPFQVPKAIDGLPETRWSSEEPQAGGEWLQVDLGSSVAINRVDVSCCVLVEGYPESLDDYGRELVIRVSEASEDFTAEPVASGAGVAGGTTFSFPPVVGRFVLVAQTGSSAVNWWSVHELSPLCQ